MFFVLVAKILQLVNLYANRQLITVTSKMRRHEQLRRNVDTRQSATVTK